MKAMAGQVWRNDDIGKILTLKKRDAKEFNREPFLARAYGWRPVFKWHNEHSEGEWNNFGCGFTILNAVRKVKLKKVESN